MNVSNRARCAFGPIVCAAMLAGCSDGQTQPALAPSPAQAVRAPSWIAKDAKVHDLLYVSSRGTEDVYVYSYPQLALEGKLTGFMTPQGECVDGSGDVFIADTEAAKIYEYAHGGTSPILMLDDAEGVPQGCAINPVNGDLAVTNIGGNPSSDQGNVGVYPHASGAPTFYTVASLYRPYFCGYDKNGNLYVDGFARPSGGFQLAELPANGNTFTTITLDQNIFTPAGVQPHGALVAVGDQGNGYVGTTAVYEFRIRGGNGALKSTTAFPDADDIIQFWIQKNTIVAPDYDGQYVGLFNYPAGGTPFAQTSVSSPFGTAVSKAPREAKRGL
jgi:hypothetical protein